MAGLVPFNRKKNDVLNTSFGDFHNMLDDFFNDNWSQRRSLVADTFKIDVQDQDKEYIVDAELPGVQKNEVDVSLEDGRLMITINKEENHEETNKNYIHKERRYSSMQRSILLGDADADGIKAKLDDGVLTIIIPKKIKPDNSVKIEIE